MHMPTSMFPILFLGLAICADALGGEGLLSRMATHSELQSAVDQTAHDIAEQKLQALLELQRLGHASPIEVDQAKKLTESLKTRLLASQDLSRRLSEITTAVRPAGNQSSEFVLLQISDFATVPGLQPLSQLKLDGNPHWQSVASMVKNAAAPTQHRSEAWTELVRRVAAADGNDSELEIVKLKQQLAVAEERLQQFCFAPVQIGASIKEFQLSDQNFSDEVQLAAHIGSSYQVNRQAAVRRQLRTSDLTSSATQPVATKKQSADLPPFALVPSQAEAVLAAETARQRVEATKRDIRWLSEGLEQLAIRCQQVGQLANEDGFFIGEAKHLEATRKLAIASKSAAEHRLQIRRAELEFATAIKNSVADDNTSGIKNWKTPLLRIYELQAITSFDEAMLQQTIDNNETMFHNLQALRASGHASWKELQAGQVRLAESLDALTRTTERGRIHTNILSGVRAVFASEKENSVAIAE